MGKISATKQVFTNLPDSAAMQLRHSGRFYCRYVRWSFLIVMAKKIVNSINGPPGKMKDIAKNISGLVLWLTGYWYCCCCCYWAVSSVVL